MAFDALPSGVRLLPDLLDKQQEAAIVEAADAGDWQSGDGLRSQQFGWWRPEFAANAPSTARFLGALPEWAAPLVRRLHVMAPFDYAPDHLVVREVLPGAFPRLSPGEGCTVATLALLADLPLEFQRRGEIGTWHLTQPRRSLLVLTERFDRLWDRTFLPQGLPMGRSRLLTLSFRRLQVK